MKRLALLGLLAAAAALVAVVAAFSVGSSGEPPVREPHGRFVEDGPPGRAVIWAVGDGADGSAAAKAVARRIRAGRVDRFLYLGDVYGTGLDSAIRGDGTGEDYRTRYAAVYRALAARTAPTPGNHEWPQRDEGYEPYWRTVIGRTPPAYYAFRAGGWQLLGLNSEAPHGARSAQVRWLRKRLHARGTCRLAFWHRPRLSAGSHGDQPDVAPLWNALRGHAALVVTGHDHNMQRFKRIDGLTPVVSGAGGHGHYDLSTSDSRLAFSDTRSYGALRIDLRPGRAKLQFVASSGRVLDTSVVRCRRR